MPGHSGRRGPTLVAPIPHLLPSWPLATPARRGVPRYDVTLGKIGGRQGLGRKPKNGKNVGIYGGAGGARTRDDQIMSLLVPAGARPPPLT